MVRASATTPRLLRAFDAYNQPRPVSERIRPYNFYLTALVAPFGHPEGVDPQRFHLAAPWSADPPAWLELPWFDTYSTQQFGVTVVDDFKRSGRVFLRTYRDVLHLYVARPEAKSLDLDEKAGRAAGLLSRRDVRAATTSYIGKESNLIEEVGMGLWHKLDEVVTELGRARDPWTQLVAPILREIPASRLVDETGLSRRTIQRLRNGHMRPHPRNAAVLTGVAGSWARASLKTAGAGVPRSDVLACSAWLDHRASS